MAKRLTDSEKWERQWFRALPPAYKLFWFYLCDRCDHAGIWHKDIALASFYIGLPLDDSEALKLFEGRVIEFRAEKWFVARFITFQYGTYHQKKSVHRAVMSRLLANGLRWPSQGLGKPLARPSHKDKDKALDKAKDKAKEKDKAFCGGAA